MTTKGELSSSNQRVSTKQQVYIGFTKAGGDVLTVTFAGALLTFYIDDLKMDPKLYGIVIMIYGIWNAINDPIFGYFSDKRKINAKGKRSFFIRYSAPLFLFGFLLFWAAFPSWTQVGLFIFLLTSLFIFDSGFTVFGLNLSALQIGQTTKTNERTKIMIIASAISFLPVGLAAILPNIVLTSSLALVYMRLIFIGMGVLAGVMMFFGAFKLKELTFEKPTSNPLPLWPALKETFRLKSFITFVCVNFMLSAVSVHLLGAMPLYFKYVSQITEREVLFISLPIGLLQIPCYFLYAFIQKKAGIRNSFFIIIGMMLLGFLGLFLSSHVAVTGVAYGVCLLMISFYGIIVNPMVGDIADEDERRTGLRREGMFFGINALITKPAASLIVFLFAFIIERFGYNAELAVQTPEAQFGIKVGVGLLAVAFLLSTIIPLLLYPLHGKKIMEIKEELERRHEQQNEKTATEEKEE